MGDLESGAYFEAIRQLILKVGKENCALGFVSFVPVISGGEQKTKLIQHGVKDLRLVGLTPDFIICRCAEEVKDEIREKIAYFTNLDPDFVFSAHNVKDINMVPRVLNNQKIAQKLLKILHFEPASPKLLKWNYLLDTLDGLDDENEVKIAIVGKYTGLHDSYLSVMKALEHGSIHSGKKLKIIWINSENLESSEETD